MTKQSQMSESFFLCALLAIIGGFLDIYTYVVRGKVFANAQTGNIVLLGLNIAEGNIKKSFYYLIPILAFMLGVFIAEKIRKYFKKNSKIHWRQVIVIIEMITILVVSFVPRGQFNMFVNIAISFISSMQVESFRKVNGNSFATTMCTGNLRSATETLFHYIQTKNIFMIKKSLQYYSIIIFFIFGAILGTFFTRIFVEKSILICFFILAVVFGIMFINKDDSFNEN
ncbi:MULTISPECIES: YoaK family protein [unclassified Clostridioides]|uniref:YoaK family protein n=1 Tax=unclassified Clostridioides TaxID=2635829 RepID=UPI001D10F2C2|nr:DUF1275 domain-containing protein [Clostridioides sp. ZZV15-6388]MCC0644870.1 DUF1275 domain-containing protein [Clostridioides sp. ZZV14-6150]MCC0661400.1 DUF1275 domain-containing protein [Clostridioides sp. ZZV14-6154]MCC0662972.1 DUF1275 domain-containing protein [Clostridioides sp. ZZV15-6597]MCC0668720.1 DUF1275 domain-containing protein [Clostridioides sp. ZZV14-6153]MCC0717974.1 DUF1275 domain-containing protein [Clostridioides sp. ZZV14-6105]MCC0721940.1 DUF1275 domain-containing 